jgi:hypothetical protein
VVIRFHIFLSTSHIANATPSRQRSTFQTAESHHLETGLITSFTSHVGSE